MMLLALLFFMVLDSRDLFLILFLYFGESLARALLFFVLPALETRVFDELLLFEAVRVNQALHFYLAYFLFLIIYLFHL
jgi:hypothetical protein